MEADHTIDLARNAIQVCLFVGGPILIVGLLIGLLVGALQTMTGIQDPTVAFVPRILLTLLVIALALPWLSGQLMDFAKTSFEKPWAQQVGSSQYTSSRSNDSGIPLEHRQ